MAAEKEETKPLDPEEVELPLLPTYNLSTAEKETFALVIVHKYMRALAMNLKDRGVTDKREVGEELVDYLGAVLNRWVRKQTNGVVTELFDMVYKQLVKDDLMERETEPEEEEFTELEEAVSELTVVQEEEEEEEKQ